jgi:hypothetical protein
LGQGPVGNESDDDGYKATESGGVVSKILILSGALMCSVPALAQDVRVVRIPDAVTCAACSIAITTVATLGQLDGPGSFTMPPSNVRMDSRGRFWVIGGHDDAAGPAVFGPDGRFIAAVGRKGQGPGEFERAEDAVILPGDSVLVLDGNRRGTIVGPDLVPRRYIPIPSTLSHSIALSWPGPVVGFSHSVSRTPGGPTLHTITFPSTDEPASLTRSFGPEWSRSDPRTMETVIQYPAAGRNGIWSAWARRYRIDHWTRDFTLDRRLERVPRWFAEESRGIGSRDRAPDPVLNAVVEDEAGRLWTFVAVAAPSWKDAWPKRPEGGGGEVRMADFAFEKMYRTTIEVIDPVAGEVLARTELDQLVSSALPGPHAVVYTADADGIVKLRVVRLTLQGL